jgi:hypothetical protein
VSAVAKGDPRGTQVFRRLTAEVVDDEPVCWLRLKGCTYWSTTADHVIPVRDRPDLALVRANLRGACLACNRRRRARPVGALITSEALSFFE